MSALRKLRRAIRRRKRNRDAHRAKHHQPRRVKREINAIRKLRHRLASYLAPRRQFDAVTLANVPHDADAVGAYKNGAFANLGEAHDRFPGGRITSISVTSSELAQVLDVEEGDATPSDCPGYFRRWREAHSHTKPIFYAPASSVAAIEAELAGIGVGRGEYIVWSAHWIGPHVCSPRRCGFPRADATQFTTHDETVDESRCRPSYWRRFRDPARKEG